MEIFRKIAEERIRRAMEAGEFDNLSNAGNPINLDDDSFVPEDLRAAYRVLKNAGCLPPELELRKEIVNLKDLIETLDDDTERLKRIRELNFRIMKLNLLRERSFSLGLVPEYEGKMVEKLIG
ncbi:MAG: DUF1992 domain-containing protein [Nitrospirae bacterium]|nr:MAG: DUF1992 domain-containing protein [Nitrospirota bacterium]